MPWFQSWPELEKKLQMKYIFGRQKKKDKCTQWFENNSKGGFVAPLFFGKMQLLIVALCQKILEDFFIARINIRNHFPEQKIQISCLNQ